jgi:hypothetical protein
MSDPARDVSLAGLMLAVTVALSAGIGFAAGSLVGLAVPLGIAGVFIGFGIGLRFVYTRFRDI